MKQKLTCAEVIASTINEHQELANAYRNEINCHRKKNNPEIPLSITKAFVFTPNKEDKLLSSVLSGKPISLELEFHDFCKHIEIEGESEMENRIASSKVNHKNWKNKLSHIRCLTRRPERFISNSQESSNYYYEKSLPRKQFFEGKDPIWCKINCSKCEAHCPYRLSEINPKNDFLTKEQVKRELKKQKHPQSRSDKVTKKIAH